MSNSLEYPNKKCTFAYRVVRQSKSQNISALALSLNRYHKSATPSFQSDTQSDTSFLIIQGKDNKKDDTKRDRNVKMWMNFSFLDRNMSDNEMDKKNEGYIKSGCGIDEKCEEIYISSISDFVVSDFFITFAHETS